MAAESSRTLSTSRGDFRDTLDLQLLHLWENVLEVDSIGIRDNFFALGGDSLAAAAVMAGVEKLFQLGLPITSLLEAPTIQQLSTIIRTAGAGKIDPHVIALRLGTKAPLFCVPSAGSDAFEFRLLASNLDENQPLFVFQAPGLDGRSCCPRSVEEVAECYVRAMRVHQPIGPYFLCGNSFGGVVAFAMAKQLVADGDKIALLAVLDSHAGEYPKRRRRLKAKARIKFALLRFLPKPGGYSFDAASFKRGTQEWLKRCLIRRLIAAERLARRRLLQCSKKVRALYVQELCFAARKRYRPNAFCGTLHLFRTLSEPPLDMFEADPFRGWKNFVTDKIEMHDLPGPHNMYLREPVVALLAQKLTASLESAQQRFKMAK
jgi:thioesterase domain-containing protein/acyl carrier protein